MILRYLMCWSTWMCMFQGAPSLGFEQVPFVQPPTSFTIRSDEFVSGGKSPRTFRRHIGRSSGISSDISNFFSSDLLSPIHTSFNSAWDQGHHFFEHSSSNFGSINFNNGHISPDFSNGLSYPDPFLRTGPDASRKASYLYSKELFFHNIPHVRSLLNNQEERRKNGLIPHQLGSLRYTSPWYRFKSSNNGYNGINGVLNF